MSGHKILAEICGQTKVAQVPNCAGGLDNKPVDSVVGSYLLNQENKHTEKVYDVLTAVFGGSIAYSYTAPFEVFLVYSAVTLANDTILYYWTDFGDGYNDVGNNPSHAYNADGEYEIKSYVITASGNKILLFAKEVKILSGVITYAPTTLPQPISRTYKVLVSAAFQNYCNKTLDGTPYNADLTAYTLVGDFEVEKPLIIDELEDNGDYQATIATPIITPLENASPNRIIGALGSLISIATNPTFTGARDVTVYNGKNVTVQLRFTTTINGTLHSVNIPAGGTYSNTLKRDAYTNEGTYVTAEIFTGFGAAGAPGEININWTT